MKKNRKLQIILAAVKRFTRHGISKTTLDEVARDLRIAKSTIYHYFQSKEELYYSSIELKSKEYLEETERILGNQEKSMEERFIEYFEYKKLLEEKYQLIYDMILLLMKNNFEPEKDALNNLLAGEKSIIRTFLDKNKVKYSNPSIPDFLVLQSWGMFFGEKLNRISGLDPGPYSKDMIQRLFEGIEQDKS